MQLSIRSNGNVLKDSQPIQLNNLVVITGENGSGKTQLLRQIEKSYSDVEMGLYTNPTLTNDSGNAFKNVIVSPPIYAHFNHESQSFVSRMRQKWNRCKNFLKLYGGLDQKKFSSVDDEVRAVNGEVYEMAAFLTKNQNLYTSSLDNASFDDINQIRSISKAAEKKPINLTYDDFIIFGEVSNTIFSPALSILFHQYSLKRKFYPEKVERIVAPWEIFNEMIQFADFNYRCEYTESTIVDEVPDIILTDISNRVEVPLSNLSTGEMTIMSLIFALYHSESGGDFPDVIMFDEPDAYLHPSLSKLLLDILQRVFIDKHQVNVILTTHSPSTVAIAPEPSIYLMDRRVGTLQKCTIGSAIKSLTAGITTLNIYYENKRQVIVEAPFDEFAYGYIYNTIRSEYLSKDKLTSFLAAGVDLEGIDGLKRSIDNGCSRVMNVVRAFQSSGSKTVFGLVDGDNVNTRQYKDGVSVIGQGQRYSLDSYVLDPILVACLALVKDLADRDSFGLKSHWTYHSLPSFTLEDLQIIVDQTALCLVPNAKKITNPIDCSDETLVDCQLLDGKVLKYPRWILIANGHDLEALYKTTFPSLNSVRKNGDSDFFKKEVIRQVIGPNKQYLCNDILKTFLEIESHDIA